MITPLNHREHFEALADIALAIVNQHLSHDRRNERIAVLYQMVQRRAEHAPPEERRRLNAMSALLYSVYCNPYLTHTTVKTALRLFAEMAKQAVEYYDRLDAEEFARRAAQRAQATGSGDYNAVGTFPRIPKVSGDDLQEIPF